MSRTSRIPHPAGSRYVAIYAWAIGRFGLAGAAIIGLLEFFDRAQPEPRLPLASRARILADLEGIAGRDAIDNALKALLDATVIEKNTITEPGLRNLERRVQYSLNPSGFARLFGAPEIRSPRNSGLQEPPEPLKSGLESGVPSIKELEVEAAAPRAPARGTADAAASGKKRNVRPSGIITWLPSDVWDAEAIEQRYTSDDITAAAAAIAAAGKQPVPGLVQQKIEQQLREAKQRAATARQLVSLTPATVPIDPVGAQKLSPTFRTQIAQKLAQKTTTQEATP